MRRLAFVVLALIAVAVSASGQEVTVRLASDSTKVRIGDWLQARVIVQAPADYKIVLPKQDKDFIRAAFVAGDSTVRETKGNAVQYSKQYTLAVFDTGSVNVAANVQYFKPGDTTSFTAVSNDITIAVSTVRIDTSKTFKDIKDVLTVPWTWWDYTLLFGGLLAAFLLAYFIWHRLKMKQNKETAEPEPEPEPEIPAEIRALERLRALEQAKLWEQGKHKEYQSELTETVREYIEKKLHVKALEETTPEIVRHVALKGIEPGLVHELEIALYCADLTKFARYTPDAVAHRQSLRTAYLFVEETRQYLDSVEAEAKALTVEPSYMPAASAIQTKVEPSPAQVEPSPTHAEPERRDGDVRK